MLSSSVLFCELPMGPLPQSFWIMLILISSFTRGYWYSQITANPSQSTFLSFPAQHWPGEFFLELCHYLKRRGYEKQKWNRTDYRPRRKYTWPHALCCEGSFYRSQVKGQRVRASQGGCEVMWYLTDCVGCHMCCVLAHFESQLLLDLFLY